ncbi:MAG: PEP-CTERM system TPR-repeat protein PrsT [Rhodocyclaceae bacterium]|nr:PEP-CTERM system TPR-repeat protein PrsT [Rhodocyclaceae bacterium]
MTFGSTARHLHRTVLALSLAFSFHAVAGDPGKAAAFYEDGLARFERGDTAGAVIQLKNALQQDDRMLSAHVLLGRALLKQTELPAAEAAFGQALKLGVSPSEIAVSRGQLLMALGRTKDVLRDIHPDGLSGEARVEVLSMRATAMASEGDERGARQAFRDAIDADPQSIRPYLSLVPFLLQQGEVLAAKESIERAMAIDPDDAGLWNLRASLLHAQGDLLEALAAYSKTLTLDGKHVDARVARASLLLDLKRDAEVARDLDYLAENAKAEPRSAYLRAVLAGRRGDGDAVQKALSEVAGLVDRLPPEYIKANEQLLMLGALAHHGLGAPQKSKGLLDALINRYPRNLGARKLLASIYMDEGDSARTLNTIEPVLRVRGDDPQALLLAGRAQLASKRYSQATRYLERAAQLMQDNAQAQAALGYSLLGGGEAEAGIASLEKAFAANPGDGGVGMVLTSLYMQRGETAKALGVAEGLVKGSRDNLAALNLLGAIRAASGDVAGARAAYEQVLQRDPDFVPAQLNLARVEAEEGRPDAARARLTTLFNKRKNDARVMHELGLLAQREGDMTEAIDWLRKAAAKQPDEPRAALALVEALHATRQSGAALLAAKEVGLRHPENLSVQAVVGQAYLAAGDAKSARQTFRDMTRLAEFDPDAQVRIGQLLLGAGFPDDAEYNAQKAFTAVRDYPPALALRVDIALARNDQSAARAALDDLRKADPNGAAISRYDAQIALASGDSARAIKAYRLAYKKGPEPRTALSLARVLFASGDAAAAGDALQTELDRMPNTEVRRALADLRMQMGAWADARTHYEKLLGGSAASVDLLNNYALVLLQLKDPAALATAEKARKLAPQDPLVADTVGWIKLHGGDVDGALGLLRDARLRAPQNPEIRYHLAEALYRSGREAEARKELDAALTDSPMFSGVEAARQLQRKLRP